MTTAEANREVLTCFVSAATGTDVRPVLQALRLAGVRTQTAEDIGYGKRIVDSFVNSVLTADFVCVVLDEVELNANVAFEVGIAAGSRRPIIVVSTVPPAQSARFVPLADLATIRFDMSPRGVENLRIGLDAFIHNVQPTAAQIAIDWDQVHQTNLSRLGSASIRGDRLTRLIAARLASAGGYVTTEADGGRDIVAEFPLLGSIGSIIVEVKAHYRGRARHARTTAQLQRAMAENGALLGLLVYNEPDDIRSQLTERTVVQEALFDDGTKGILIVSAAELIAWTDAQLIAELTKLRNTVFHGPR